MSASDTPAEFSAISPAEEVIVAKELDDGYSALIKTEYTPPAPIVNKKFTREEIIQLIDELMEMPDSELLALPEFYCQERGINYEEYHKPLSLRETFEKKQASREQNTNRTLERLRKKLAKQNLDK